jgi:RNA polymerase sigma-70 factor (ECF subfamily)
MTRAAPPLAAMFAHHTEHDTRQLDPAALEASLADLLAAARARWPEVELDAAAAIADLAACWAPEQPVPRTAVLPAFAVELLLARGCLRGDAAALRVLDREMFDKAARVLVRLQLNASDADDVRQDVQTKLLVGDRPRLAQYEGTGPLAQWIASVAGREGLRLLRRRRITEPLDDDALLDGDDDPELATLNARHGADFKRAFQAAVTELPPRDRVVLRALLVDDRSVNDIAALYKIHRVTASRWVAEVRQRLLRETRRRLQDSLQLDAASLDSAVRIVAGGLDLSLYRLLAGSHPP